MPTTDDGYGDLFDLLRLTPPEEAFLDFHRKNPHVYACIESAARRNIAANGGRVQRTSVDYLVHYTRWHGIGATDTARGEFKIANQHTPFYARLLLARHPEWSGLFETRRSVADDSAAWLGEAA